MTAGPFSAGLACANAITRSGLLAVLEAGGIAVGPTPTTEAELAGAAHGAAPDLWIVDGGFPGGSAAAVRVLRPSGRPVVVLSGDLGDRAIREAVDAGALGYLPTDMPGDELPRVLRRVLDGEAAIPRSVMGHLLRDLHAGRHRIEVLGADGRAVTLTPRESAVLEALALGNSAQVVAADLGLSPVTVRRHAASAARRLGVRDRAAAIGLLHRQAR